MTQQPRPTPLRAVKILPPPSAQSTAPVARPAPPVASFVTPQSVRVGSHHRKTPVPATAAAHIASLKDEIAQKIRVVASLLNIQPTDDQLTLAVEKISNRLKKLPGVLSFKPGGEAINFSGKIQSQLPVLQDYEITKAQWWGAIIKQPQLLMIKGQTIRTNMQRMVPALRDENVGKITPQDHRLHPDTGVNRILKDPQLLHVSPETLALSQLYAATYFRHRQPEHRVVVKFSKIRDAWRKKAGLDKWQVPDPNVVAEIAAKQIGNGVLTPEEVALLTVSQFKQRRRSA